MGSRGSRRQVVGATSSIPNRCDAGRQVALCELLDRVLNKGVVLVGEVTISVADIELLYLGINLVVSSWETMLAASRGVKVS